LLVKNPFIIDNLQIDRDNRELILDGVEMQMVKRLIFGSILSMLFFNTICT